MAYSVNNAQMYLSRWMSIIKKSKWLILSLILFSLVFGFLYYQFQENSYKTCASFKINGSDIDTQLDVLGTEFIKKEALNKLQIDNLSLSQIKDQLKFKRASSNSSVIKVAFEDKSKKISEKYLSEFIKQYLIFDAKDSIGKESFKIFQKLHPIVDTKESLQELASLSNKTILDYKIYKEPKAFNTPFIPLLVSFIIGSLLALLYTLLSTLFDNKIKSKNDITELSDLPIFGMIPFVRDAKLYNNAYVLKDPNSAASEALREIRTNLEYIVSPNKSKVILVSSTIPNEGKTAVSANLAAILGMSEKKSVIVSLDMRRPELHHKFGLSNKVGISDVLSGRSKLEDVIWEHEEYENFNIITSGRVPPNPAELISSSKMKDVLEELKKDYDYVVIDSPPIDFVSDALSLMRKVDITLFVVKSDFSDKSFVKKIDSLTKRLKLENVGFILNSVKDKYLMNAKFDHRYIYYEQI
jgi:capsular exopolysaccharide synthesis family protein